MHTQALVVEEPGRPFKLRDVVLSNTIPDDEVRIRIKATGVCHTDINFSNEPSMPELYPGVLGHEGAGIVERVGSKVTLVQPGDHVIATYTCCGECQYCERKETSYCDLWFQHNFGIGRLDGSKAFKAVRTDDPITSHFFGQSSFANHVHVKETGLIKVSKDLPFEILAPLGCGFMTGAGAMLNVLEPQPDHSVAVVGVGAVGLAAIMSLKLLPKPPKRIIAVDIIPERLKLAQKYGATHGVNSKDRNDFMEVMMDITKGQGLDGSIDTTGRPAVLKNLINASARKGKVVSVGVGKLNDEASMNIFNMVNSGCSYIGCAMGSCYPQEFIPRLLQAYEDGKFPFDDLIETYRPRDVNQAVEDMLKGRTVKAVLMWD